MKKLNYIFIALFILTAGMSCGEDSVTEDFPPAKATLSFPENNSDCYEGTIVSATESEVTFRWSTTENADSYTLQITNLDSGTSQSVASKTAETKVTIRRATAFSWSVISKSNSSSKTAMSDTWKFYNAGSPDQNHVPNPATLVSPGADSKVKEGTVSLEWDGSDLDNDIVSYEVYIDNFNPPITLAGTSTSNKLEVNVVEDHTYYWQVITIDAIGNKSTSEVFNFKAEEEAVGPSANLVLDGEMNDTGEWNYKQMWTNADNNVEHGYENGEFKFKSADGVTHSNAVLWQEIEVEAGKTYNFSANIRSEGTINSWLEVYFGKQSVESSGDDYTEGGAEVFVKSFGENENCGIDAFDGDILAVASGGCPLPDDSLLDTDGNVTFSAADLTSDGTIILVIKAGNWDGNFSTGVFIDNVELKEVE